MTLTINKMRLLFLQADSFNTLSSFHGCFLKIKTNQKKKKRLIPPGFFSVFTHSLSVC